MIEGITFLNKFIDVMLATTRVIQNLIEYSAPFFLECRTYSIQILRNLRRLNKRYNPLLILEEEPPAVIHHCEADTFFRNIFVIICLISFIWMVIWFSRFYRKKDNETSTSLDSQVEDFATFKKQNYERLREIHKMLLELKCHLASVPENRTSQPILDNSMPYPRSDPPTKSLYSSVSKWQNNEVFPKDKNAINLSGTFQKALQLLEDQIGGRSTDAADEGEDEDEEHLMKSFDEDERLCIHETDANKSNANPHKRRSQTEQKCLEPPPWMKSSEMNEFLSLGNNRGNKRILSNEQKVAETCTMCLKMKEALLNLQQQMDGKPAIEIFSAVSKSGLQCRKCSEEDKMLNRILETNTRNFQTSCVQKNSGCDCESSKINAKAGNTSDALNASRRQKALSVEILFNRDIRLSETVVK